MTCINVIVFTSLTFLILAFLLYIPLPEALEEPWPYRLGELGSSGAGIIGVIVSKITGRPRLEVMRNILTSAFPKTNSNYPELKVEDLKFADVPVRVYTPKNLNGPAPCIIYLHGGGWVLLNVDIYDSVTANLSLGTGMIVVSVDYRLAPENPYPAPVDDCFNAVKYILQHGHKYGIDVKRVALMGDSAGGHLTAVTSLKMAQEEPTLMPQLKTIVLIYPITQVVNFRTSSYHLYRNYPVINRKNMMMFACAFLQVDPSPENLKRIEMNRHLSPKARELVYTRYFQDRFIPGYVRQNPQKENINPSKDAVNEDDLLLMNGLVLNPYVSPLISDNLSKLPPAYILVAEFDVLRDDGLLFANRLKQEGVKVDLSYVKGQPHSFMGPYPTLPSFLQFKGGRPEWGKINAYLKKNL